MPHQPAPPLVSHERRKRSLRQRHWLREASRRHRAGDDVRAFDYASRAALAGDSEAQTAVALAYLLGRGVPVHPGAAAQWFERAATGGEVEAMVGLAKMTLQGLIPNQPGARSGPDFALGHRWASLAAGRGALEGKLLLANVALFGPDELRDVPAATGLFREAADAGSAAGRLGLAMALLKGRAATAKAGEITRLIQQAAEQDLPAARYLSGVMREFGLGLSQDLGQALEAYRVAAEAGVRPAQTRYGFALVQRAADDRDAAFGETWLRRAALAGDAVACGLVGMIYAAPCDMPPNHAEACLWFRRAAELGHPLAAGTSWETSEWGGGCEASWWAGRLRQRGSLPPADDPACHLSALHHPH